MSDDLIPKDLVEAAIQRMGGPIMCRVKSLEEILAGDKSNQQQKPDNVNRPK